MELNVDDLEIGDRVSYTPGFRGWHAAEVIGFCGDGRVEIRLDNGYEMTCWAGELERN